MLIMPDGVDFPSWMLSSVAAVIVLLVTLFAARSTELALKLQRPIMVLIFASIFSLLAGSFYREGRLTQIGLRSTRLIMRYHFGLHSLFSSGHWNSRA